MELITIGMIIVTTTTALIMMAFKADNYNQAKVRKVMSNHWNKIMQAEWTG